MCAMGSCIKVVKQKKKWFPTEKKMLSPVDIQKQNRRFSVMGIRKIINSLPLRRKILRVRSNKLTRIDCL
jgi:hypothetical protein